MSYTPGAAGNQAARPSKSHTHETKAFYKTSEFIFYVVVSVAILIAAAMVDNGEDGQGFGADKAWSYVALLTVGYMISRGLSKAGSHHRDNH
ncbi:hypothetical protein ACFFGH_29000 [Lysobacter korlensis]|uniref:Uncharacterized protein n=1 Tax=Lysobacter korlensis TaxID=553636 RepID=A0ABV6RY32_9GAMM